MSSHSEPHAPNSRYLRPSSAPPGAPFHLDGGGKRELQAILTKVGHYSTRGVTLQYISSHLRNLGPNGSAVTPGQLQNKKQGRFLVREGFALSARAVFASSASLGSHSLALRAPRCPLGKN